MTIYYNDVDITDHVEATVILIHDMSGGCFDYLEIEFENAAIWLSWNPQTDDTIEIVHGTFTSGIMYLSCVYPSDGKFKILATAVPSSSRRKLNASYRNMNLSVIARTCASECEMDETIYGIDDYFYEYLIRDHESCAAFLERISIMEGACLKCYNGVFSVIGIASAQRIEASQTIEQDNAMLGFDYAKDDNQRVRKLTVITPYARYTAEDTGANSDIEIIRTDLPAVNKSQAMRWAKGLLLSHNRKSETITVSGSFNEGHTAMARIDITGENELSGEWIVHEVVHDLISMTSTTTMYRCIDTVV